mmetsp:Transcript_13450/g.20149  ORF Transcript_13450/g.20149 Transcript_13450/m.20149 type:complete len:213 (-) Transcript_13450:494-1132(-)
MSSNRPPRFSRIHWTPSDTCSTAVCVFFTTVLILSTVTFMSSNFDITFSIFSDWSASASFADWSFPSSSFAACASSMARRASFSASFTFFCWSSSCFIRNFVTASELPPVFAAFDFSASNSELSRSSSFFASLRFFFCVSTASSFCFRLASAIPSRRLKSASWSSVFFLLSAIFRRFSSRTRSSISWYFAFSSLLFLLPAFILAWRDFNSFS